MSTPYHPRRHRTRPVRALQARLAAAEQALETCQRELAALQHITDTAARTEADLQVALTKYRTLFDSFPLGIAVTNAQGQIVEANQMAEILVSLWQKEQRQRAIDDADWQIVRPDGSQMPPAEYAAVRALREQRRVENVEMGLLTPHGETTWIAVTAAPLALDGTGIVITCNDITARRQAEALVAVQRDLARLIATTTDPAVAWPRCLALALQVCALDCGGMYLLDADTQTLDMVAHHGLSAGFVEATSRYALDAAHMQLLHAGKPVCWSHADLQQIAVFRHESLSCAIIMPIYAHGHVLGCVSLGSRTLPEAPAFARQSLETIATEIGNIVVALRTAAALRELNQTLESRVAERTAEVQDLYDHAPVGYHSLDSEGRIVRINQTALDWLGYTREEILGRTLCDFMAPTSQAIEPGCVELIRAAGGARDIERELIRKEGSTFPALINATAIYDKHGSFVMTRSTMTDLTLHKQIEVALRASEERLRLSEARLQLLLAKTPAVIFSSLAEPDFHTTFISESVRAMLGYEPDQFLSGLSFWSDRIHPEDKPHIFGDATQLFAQGWRQYEYRCRHADGSYRWVETGVSLLPASASHPAEVVGYMIDITERKQAEALIQRANADLARVAQAKDEFLANMSHELRTPLTAVLGYSEILCAEIRGPLLAGQQNAVRNIEASAQHLLAMITDILDLAKGEAGKLAIHPERVVIATVCAASLMFVNEQALKKRLQLDTRIADPQAVIEADPLRLKQMLVNLLTNAVKFTPGGGQIFMDVQVDASADRVHFSVEDTGIGVAPEDMGRLFQPFSQLDSALSRQQAGTGLGLALVRRLAKLHGGEVHVASAVGIGSRFTITLPIRQPAPRAPAPEALGDPAGASSAVDPARARLLVTDDSTENLHLVAEYLRARGYVVVTARSGQEALAQAGAAQPALILMDIQMPDLDGLETIRRLRAMPATATVPIIALTALAMPGDRERCLAAGANTYLTRPVRFEDLLGAIRRLLG